MIKSSTVGEKSDRVRAFSDREISANCALFLLAGTETSTLALSIISYLLATHPEEQEKLYQEIKSASDATGGDNQILTSETVAQLEYLNAVVMESLRLYPPASNSERKVSQELLLMSSSN
jgi:cytochrome P450